MPASENCSRSSGLRPVTGLPSFTTGSSRTWTPASLRSPCTVDQASRVVPFNCPAARRSLRAVADRGDELLRALGRAHELDEPAVGPQVVR